MATLLCFHAHPDDECIQTGGLIARAKSQGHRVILVVATGGEHGERPEDMRADEALADRRAEETRRSAATLGADAVHFLGYEDSGMTGWEQNANDLAFMNAPLDEAAARLAAILTAERVDTLTVYDHHGGYGHPDHIAVNKVGHRAAELADTPYVYEATMNRDRVLAFMAAAREAGQDVDFDPDDTDDGTPFGMPESEITTEVDVMAFVDLKRQAMACHASQISDSSFFLQMPPEAFQAAFGTEWFIRRGVPGGIQETWLAGLEPVS